MECTMYMYYFIEWLNIFFLKTYSYKYKIDFIYNIYEQL